MRSNIGLAMKGLAMGMAEVVPGVSGGTIAFITGIYEELIETIKSVDIDFFKLVFSGRFADAFAKVNGKFLLALVAGMLMGIVISLFLVTYLMENHQEGLWGFFFGLILASSVYIGKQISNWNMTNIVLLVVGAFVSYVITIVTPANGTEALPFVFLSGMIAISALILPGISGSFILLLLGMYSIIIPNVKELLSSPNLSSLIITIVFGLGCLTGLAVFARVLSHAFKNYKDATLAILTGFMIGSLNKIWPWRNPTSWMNKDSLEKFTSASSNISTMDPDRLKILSEANVLPAGYQGEANVSLVLISLIIGIALIYVVSKIEVKTN